MWGNDPTLTTLTPAQYRANKRPAQFGPSPTRGNEGFARGSHGLTIGCHPGLTFGDT